MMLPLLCASLLVAGLCAPAAVPHLDNEELNNTSVQRKGRVSYDDDGERVFIDSFDDEPRVYWYTFDIADGTYYDLANAEFTEIVWRDVEDLTANGIYLDDGDGYSNLTFDEIALEDGNFYIAFYDQYASDNSALPVTAYIQFTMFFDDSEVVFRVYRDNFFSDVMYYDSSSNPVEDDYNILTPNAPAVSVDGVEVVNEIVSILGAGVGSLGAAIGAGVASFAESLAFDGNGNLSVYFIMVIALCGVSLSIALTTRIFGWLTSLGN